MKNGEDAKFQYDRVIALWPGSRAEPWALERLWQYHWAKGENEQAEKYFGFLESRHPEHPNLDNKPDFAASDELKRLAVVSEPRLIAPAARIKTSVKPDVPTKGKWTVQLGAFSKREGAKEVARKVVDLGPVELKEKTVNNKKLIVVHFGGFSTKQEADEISHKIQRKTGIRGRVILLKD